MIMKCKNEKVILPRSQEVGLSVVKGNCTIVYISMDMPSTLQLAKVMPA